MSLPNTRPDLRPPFVASAFPPMAKSAVFGLASGLAVVVLTMIVVAVVNLPQASDAAASGDAPQCREIVQDQGYGLVRSVKHEGCQTAADRG